MKPIDNMEKARRQWLADYSAAVAYFPAWEERIMCEAFEAGWEARGPIQGFPANPLTIDME